MRCEHKHKRKHFRSGQSFKVQCSKESKMQDENGNLLCKHHFNRWFKKKYNEDYDTLMNAES